MTSLLAAAAIVAACAQAPSNEARVSILKERELELVLADGWPAGPMPWTLVVDGDAWRKLLASGERFEGDAATVRATTAPHVTLHGTCAEGASHASVALDFAFHEGAEERAVDGAPLDPMHPQARIAPEAAVALRMLRADPLRERASFEPVGGAPLIERERGAATVKFRFPPVDATLHRENRAWVAVKRDGDAVDVFPVDHPAGADHPPERSSPEWLTIPRYRLEGASESVAFRMDAQALQQLADESADFPDSPDPVALRASLLMRLHKCDEALATISGFMPGRSDEARESVGALEYFQALLWAITPSGASIQSVRASARVGRCEVLGDSEIPNEEFVAASRVLQIAASALDRLHLVDHAQTFVVVVVPKQEAANSPGKSMRIGWIDVTQLPIVDDPTALARAFLRAHSGLEHAAAGTDALAAFVAGLAGRPPTSPELVAAAELARRTLDGEGPAALARFVRSDSPPAAPRSDLPSSGSVRLESLGHASFRFTADDGTRLLIDPYSSRYWLQMRFPWVGADHVVVTHDHPDHDAIDEVLGTPHVVEFEDSASGSASSTPRSARAGPFELQAFVAPHDRRYGELENLVVRTTVAGVSFVHLGDVQAPLSDELCRALKPVDVLLAPIDDRGHVLDGAALAGIVKSLAPRVVIPMHYCRTEIQGDVSDLGSIDAWLATAPNVKRIDRANVDVAKRDLPGAAETWVLQPRAWPEGRLEGIR
jgi:L-ascorbate metabolism protein UlaG (beta-lactamase superfamily)